eukprot:jgi/Psemu1/54711/gm1.54711_g
MTVIGRIVFIQKVSQDYRSKIPFLEEHGILLLDTFQQSSSFNNNKHTLLIDNAHFSFFFQIKQHSKLKEKLLFILLLESKRCNLWYRQQQMERHQNDRDLLVGPALVSLVVCIIIYPQAQLDEIAMYLYNDGIEGAPNHQQEAEHRSFKAHSPANMRMAFLFWNRQLPIGMVGIPRKHFIDVNEFAMEAKWLNWSNSWSICFRRVRTVGKYEKGPKLTVMIAVEPGDPELPADDWKLFLDSAMGRREKSSWDYRPIVYETVMGRVGPALFSILPCLVYQPKYGLVKYVICQLLNHMKVTVTGELDLNQMEQQILDSAATIGPFDAMFAHCGYSEDGVYPGVEIRIDPNADPPGWGPLAPPGAG